MKKIFTTLILVLLFSSNALGITLYEALNDTFKNNTQLNAERENIKVSEEDINISEADYMPSLTLTGSKSFEDTNKLTNQSGGDASVSDVNTLTSSIKLEQTLLDHGRDLSHEKNIVGLELAKAKLTKKEQDVIYSAIEAFTGLILAREKLEINRRNLNLLIRQVETDKVRLDRGQITIADLAQSESSLAGAKANFAEAQSNLFTSKLNYENVIGSVFRADDLKKSSNAIAVIPKSVNEAIEFSKKNNPDLIISKLEFEQSEKDVKIAKSDLSPSATLSLESSKTDDLSSTYDESDKETVTATVSWPIFKGGKNLSSVKKAKFTVEEKQLLFNDISDQVNIDTANAWTTYNSSKSVLDATTAQLKAAEIANEGITLEYDTGNKRTTLEVIQSRTLLLDARTSYAKAQKDFAIAQFNLLASIGDLHLDNIK